MTRKADKPSFAMSRRRKASIIALCLLLAAFVVRLDHTTAPLSQQPKSKNQQILFDLEKYDQKSFVVVNVVDGDTIDINIPDNDKETTRIRLWGVDTPETKHPERGVMYFGPEAAEFSRKLTLGKQVTVYLEEHRTRGYYGRLLAYIQLPDKSFLNEILLSKGFAYADVRFRHIFYNKYKQLEAAARSQKKGLWPKLTREQLPDWLQKRKPNLLKKK